MSSIFILCTSLLRFTVILSDELKNIEIVIIYSKNELQYSFLH